MTRICAALLTAVCLAFGGAAQARPQVIIYSGLMDFSGAFVSHLAGRLHHCADVQVYNHMAASPAVATAAARRGPLFLVGHSMGGDAAVEKAAQIAPTRVAGVITIDPTRNVGRVPRNVARAINIWQPVGLGGGHGFGAHDIELTGVGHTGMASDSRTEAIVVGLVCGGKHVAKVKHNHRRKK